MKKWNSLFIILLISTFVHCQNIETKVPTLDTIKRVQIESVDFSIITCISVKCNDFEKCFEKYKEKTIVNHQKNYELLRCLRTLQPMDSTYNNVIDTRAKVKLLTENDSIIICVGNLILSMGDDIYKTAETLINFIEDLE